MIAAGHAWQGNNNRSDECACDEQQGTMAIWQLCSVCADTSTGRRVAVAGAAGAGAGAAAGAPNMDENGSSTAAAGVGRADDAAGGAVPKEWVLLLSEEKDCTRNIHKPMPSRFHRWAINKKVMERTTAAPTASHRQPTGLRPVLAAMLKSGAMDANTARTHTHRDVST